MTSEKNMFPLPLHPAFVMKKRIKFTNAKFWQLLNVDCCFLLLFPVKKQVKLGKNH